MADDLMFRPAADLAAMVRDGDVSARELVEASYEAIGRMNGELNAFVTLCEERALGEADAMRAGDERPLAGVPIAIKDLVAVTEGVRTTFGSAAMADWVPDHDSALVRRIRDAGAIVVGKTNLPEFGILPVSEPDLFGPCRNPWDTSRTPGGSSGGSASALAAGMVPIAHANDGGGTIRIPAS
jgi:amidase